jgi:uncharacterized protein YjbJ (UPF0337 family)
MSDLKRDGKTDEMKGRAKEAAGAVSGDGDLKREGQADQTEGKTKQAMHDAKQAGKNLKDAVTGGK